MMKRYLNKVSSGFDLALGIAGLIGILVMTAGVFTRYVLKVSLAWSDEFLRTLFVWCYFIGGAMMHSKYSLMRLELIDDFLNKHHFYKAKVVISIIVELLLAIFFSYMTYCVYSLTMGYIAKGTTSSTSSVPAWVLILGMGIGFVMIVLISLYHIYKYLKPDVEAVSEPNTEAMDEEK